MGGDAKNKEGREKKEKRKGMKAKMSCTGTGSFIVAKRSLASLLRIGRETVVFGIRPERKEGERAGGRE